MPQLNIVYFPSQILWLLLSFLTLYFIVKYFFVPKIENLLEYRTSKIKLNLEEASKFRDCAISLENDYNKLHTEMHDHISSMRMEVLENLKKKKAQSIADLQRKIQKKEESMISKISLERKKAIEKMPEYILENASLIIYKMTSKKIDLERLSKFYGENKC